MATLQRVPSGEPLLYPDGTVTRRWLQWFGIHTDRINAGPDRLVFKQLTAQGAAIAATSFVTPSLSPGVYRVSYYARITRAASTSSSLTVTVGHTDGAIAITQAGAAMTGNTTATVQSGTAVVRIDSATPITFATAYSSSGATTMQYRLDLVLETVAVEDAS